MKARPQILMFALWLLSQALGFGMTGLFHESGHNAQPSAIGEQIPPVNYGYDTIQGASLAYDVAHTTPTLLDCILAVVAKETGYDYDQPIVLFIRKVESSRGPPSGFDGFLAADTGAFSAIGSTGKVGEQWLAQNLGGESQVYFNTTQGGRYVDQLVGDVANESKVGYQSLTPSIQLQISKDAELLNGGTFQSVNWHFFQSPVTGLGGPSQPLLNALQQNGINVIIH